MNLQDNKAITRVFSTFHQVMTMTSGQARQIKAVEAWLPRYLYPSPDGYFAALNNFGFLIGRTLPTKIRPEWAIPNDALNLAGLEKEEGGYYDLFRPNGEPWSDESSRKSYLGKLTRVFGIPHSAVTMARPQHRAGVFAE